jgi:hypothetical protein
MGLSLVTTGSAYVISDTKPVGAPLAVLTQATNGLPMAPQISNQTHHPKAGHGFFGDLITENVSAQTGKPALSIAKFQMLVWTIISLTLFVAKSFMNGEIWPVPWELVVLMGISQTSYLVPKYWSLKSN